MPLKLDPNPNPNPKPNPNLLWHDEKLELDKCTMY